MVERQLGQLQDVSRLHGQISVVALLNLVIDLLAIWKETNPDWTLASRDSFLLLQQVFLENFEIDPRRPAADPSRAAHRGALQNPHEPEAQWSSKSTTRDKSWVGYKVQVAETLQEEPRQAGEPTANFLTALVTQDAPDSDKAGMARVLDEQQEMGLERPATLYVDGCESCPLLARP